MSEERPPYKIEGIEIGTTIAASDGYQIRERTDGWIKFSTDFRNETLASLSGSELKVFMCIALHVDKDYRAYPSLDTIAKETGMARSTVQEAVRSLTTMDLIEVIPYGSKKNTNLYTIKAFVGYISNPQNLPKIGNLNDGELTDLGEELTDLPPKVTDLDEDFTAPSVTKESIKEKVKKEENNKEDWFGASPRALINHPAMLIYVHLAHSNIASNQRKKVAEKVGTHPQNLEAWGRAVSKWLGKGYNPRNVDGILEWFRKENGAVDREKFVTGEFAQYVKT